MKVKTIFNEIPTLPTGTHVTGVDWKVNIKADFTGTAILNELNNSEHKVKTFQHSFANGEPVFVEVITHLSTGENITSGTIPVYEDTITMGNAPIAYAPILTSSYIGMNTTLHFSVPKFMDNGVVFDRIELKLCDLGHRPFYECDLETTHSTFILTPSDYRTSAFIAEVTYVTDDGIKSQTGRLLLTPEVNLTGNDPRLESYIVLHNETTLIRAVNTNTLYDGSGAFMFNSCALIPDYSYAKTIALQGDTEEKIYGLTHNGTIMPYTSSFNTVSQSRVSFRIGNKLYQSTGKATFKANGTTYHATLPDSAFANVDMVQVNDNTVVLCSEIGFNSYLIEVTGTTINFIHLTSFEDSTSITQYAHTVVKGVIYIGDKYVNIYTGDYILGEWHDSLAVENVEAKLNSSTVVAINVSTGESITHNNLSGIIKSIHYCGDYIGVYTTKAIYTINTSGSMLLLNNSTAGVTNQAKSTTYQYKN